MKRTHRSGQQLQPLEVHGEAGCGVMHQLRDGDEAKVDQEGEEIEHEQPLEEQEVGEDASSELAANLLERPLPDLQGLPG